MSAAQNAKIAACAAAGVGFAFILYAVLATPPRPACTPQDIQAYIISAERPAMGPIERRMWVDAIYAACTKHGVDPLVCTAKVAQETTFNGRAVNATSGARGAGQLMAMHVKGFDPFEIEANLDKMAEVYAGMLKERNGDVRRALRYYVGGNTAETGAKKAETAAYADAIVARVYFAKERACAAK